LKCLLNEEYFPEEERNTRKRIKRRFFKKINEIKLKIEKI
jgi:hypothetical protein